MEPFIKFSLILGSAIVIAMALISYAIARYIEKRSQQRLEESDLSLEKDFKKTPKVEQALKAIMELYKTYACSDARTYPSTINPDRKQEVLDRYARLPEHHLQYEAVANGAAQPTDNRQYTPRQLKRIHILLDKAKSGCCTTLAISAAHQIMTNHPDYRVEIVASCGGDGMVAHCFLIVNRKKLFGERQDGISAPESWGQGAFVVDPWLVTLGWDQGVYAVKDYPYQGYLTNIERRYDSESEGRQMLSKPRVADVTVSNATQQRPWSYAPALTLTNRTPKII